LEASKTTEVEEIHELRRWKEKMHLIVFVKEKEKEKESWMSKGASRAHRTGSVPSAQIGYSL
jgi:hypothetical protein